MTERLYGIPENREQSGLSEIVETFLKKERGSGPICSMIGVSMFDFAGSGIRSRAGRTCCL
jgi:hypothetical protein